ncbi:MAG: hypothetical protein JW891_12370 [Candidatus Lokiarchaeota archaeon]|nr:hypothetical protein [Candidatus Lokiarchaeota archaeon]
MIGTLLIGYNDKTGPFIDIQIPSLLLEVEDIDVSYLKELYQEQRNLMEGPTYMIKQIKPELFACYFYTGYSVLHYVGRPGYCVFVFYSEKNDVNENLEGMIRRLAHELLPQKETPTFSSLLHDYYELIKKGELGQYWGEIGEKQPPREETILITEPESTITPVLNENMQILKDELEAEKAKVAELNLQLEDLKKQYENLEIKLKEKTEQLGEKEKKSEELIAEIKILKEVDKNSEHQSETIKNQEREIEDLNLKINELGQQLNEVVELRKIAQNSKQQEEIIEKKSKEFLDLQSQFTNLSAKFEELTSQNANLVKNSEIIQEEIGSLKNDNNNFLTIITDLKLELKKKKEEIVFEKREKEKIDDEIIDLKKEIKVLRRERDHYKQIVKEKNLL